LQAAFQKRICPSYSHGKIEEGAIDARMAYDLELFVAVFVCFLYVLHIFYLKLRKSQ
jgi:hypothetical protein